MEVPALARSLRLPAADLKREIAALRHMERVRAELREGKKVVVLG